MLRAVRYWGVVVAEVDVASDDVASDGGGVGCANVISS